MRVSRRQDRRQHVGVAVTAIVVVTLLGLAPAGAHSDVYAIPFTNCASNVTAEYYSSQSHSTVYANGGAPQSYCTGARSRIRYSYQGTTYYTSSVTDTTPNGYGEYWAVRNFTGNAHPPSIYNNWYAVGKNRVAWIWNSYYENLWT